MQQLIFATGNPHKIKEINAMLNGSFLIRSMKDIGCTEELPETQETLKGNALQKARYLKEHYCVDCFSEDTGLEIVALNGAPGVLTARYAGNEKDPQANMDKVLQMLKDTSNRTAQFRTLIALLWKGKEYLFEGIAKGRIATAPSGTEGFGYDPIFIPEGYTSTFAEMNAAEKNKISHRAKAVQKLIAFLKTQEVLSS